VLGHVELYMKTKRYDEEIKNNRGIVVRVNPRIGPCLVT